MLIWHKIVLRCFKTSTGLTRPYFIWEVLSIRTTVIIKWHMLLVLWCCPKVTMWYGIISPNVILCVTQWTRNATFKWFGIMLAHGISMRQYQQTYLHASWCTASIFKCLAELVGWEAYKMFVWGEVDLMNGLQVQTWHPVTFFIWLDKRGSVLDETSQLGWIRSMDSWSSSNLSCNFLQIVVDCILGCLGR